jgi:hypothetical protein
MSVLSTLALLVTTAAVKSRPKKADRVAEFEAEIAGLKIDLADARRDLDHALSERDALRYELLRYEVERDLLRHGDHPLQQIPAGPDFRPPVPLGGQHAAPQAMTPQWRQNLQNAQAQQWAQQNAQAQQNQAAMQQQYAAMQNAQIYGQGLCQQGLAQQLGAQAEMWCNCVPSRAQVWAARNDGY